MMMQSPAKSSNILRSLSNDSESSFLSKISVSFIIFLVARSLATEELNQTGYICNVLARFGMSECKLASTPLAVGAQLTHSQSPTTPEDYAAYTQSSNGIVYLEGIGSVLYITQTHPDIQHLVGILAQFGANPGKAHIEAFKRLLCYLKGTAEFVLTLGSKDTGTDLIGWTNSDWAQDPDSRWSVGSYVFDVAGGSVSWASKRQPIVTLTNGTVTHSRAKHIDICHHFIHERVANSEIDLQYVSTKEMLADILTKQLLREAPERYRKALGVGER
jgi:hypothetical protein